MQTLALAIAIAFLAFGSGVVGLRLRAWLPERHAPDRAREMIGSMTGLLGLLLPMVAIVVSWSLLLFCCLASQRNGHRDTGPRRGPAPLDARWSALWSRRGRTGWFSWDGLRVSVWALSA